MFIFYELPPSVYTVSDLSDFGSEVSELSIQIEYDDNNTKTRLYFDRLLTWFIGARKFDENFSMKKEHENF